MEENNSTQQPNIEAQNSENRNNTKKHSLKSVMRKVWKSILDFSHLRDDTDYEGTIESISSGVEFRGVNVWVLAFAIIIASVGLNVNSTAVIIGAMLISPLMGPITGIGLSVGILDDDLLLKSLRNLLIMVLISLTASTLYFLISPLSEAQSELLARIRPTIYDVLIAFFGGLAGIVATSRKSQPFTVISGVAIATALMPPLCTAGYGLATLQIRFFGGAFFLFFINSFFIALATYLMVRYLGFPQKKYFDEKRQRAVKRLIYIFSSIILIPSVFMTLNLLKETSFNSQSTKFINEIQQSQYFKNAQIIESNRDYSSKKQTITLRVIGHPFTNEDILKLQTILTDDYGLTGAKLVIKQTDGSFDITQQSQIIEDIIDKKDAIIHEKDSVINDLQKRIHNTVGDEELSAQIVKEIHSQYPEIQEVSISELNLFNTNTLENSYEPVIYIKWNNQSNHNEAEKKLVEWLKIRLNVENLQIIRM